MKHTVIIALFSILIFAGCSSTPEKTNQPQPVETRDPMDRLLDDLDRTKAERDSAKAELEQLRNQPSATGDVPKSIEDLYNRVQNLYRRMEALYGARFSSFIMKGDRADLEAIEHSLSEIEDILDTMDKSPSGEGE